MRETRIFAESFNNSDDIAIKFEWDVPPDDYPDYPLTYYILLDNLDVGYKTHNSTSVTLSPLSRNFTYTFLVRREEKSVEKEELARKKKKGRKIYRLRRKERERERRVLIFLSWY